LSSFTSHRPAASALAVFVCFMKVTVTPPPGCVVPHTGTSMSRCRTMWSLKIAGVRPGFSGDRPCGAAAATPAGTRQATTTRGR